MSKFVWILDPGHGGLDPETDEYVTSGKRSPVWDDGTQYFEGVGNRDIVKRILNKCRNETIESTLSIDNVPYKGNAALNAQKS